MEQEESQMKLHNLKEFYLSQLRQLYEVEKQIEKELPKLVKASTSPELQDVLRDHLEQTRGHARRLEGLFESLGEKAQTERCLGFKGILDEAGHLLGEFADPAVLNVALVAAAQRMEHYEIAAYGSVRAYAEQLGEEESAQELDRILEEEERSDEVLSELAETSINPKAPSGNLPYQSPRRRSADSGAVPIDAAERLERHEQRRRDQPLRFGPAAERSNSEHPKTGDPGADITPLGDVGSVRRPDNEN
jgi:ferritin-like metal-binding protein YciE